MQTPPNRISRPHAPILRFLKQGEAREIGVCQAEMRMGKRQGAGASTTEQAARRRAGHGVTVTENIHARRFLPDIG